MADQAVSSWFCITAWVPPLLSKEAFLFGFYDGGAHLITIVEESWIIHHNVGQRTLSSASRAPTVVNTVCCISSAMGG
jgi:hypothetical protein